nr:9035_t:CDS:2 [Entrophospora candida]
MSPAVSELVKLLLEKSKSLNKRGMMVSLPPIPTDFEAGDKEFKDICIMHRIMDSILLEEEVREMKDLEEDFNRVPVFGIQVAGQSSLARFVNELWKLRATLWRHISILNKIVEKVDAFLYDMAFYSPQSRENAPLYGGELVTPQSP